MLARRSAALARCAWRWPGAASRSPSCGACRRRSSPCGSRGRRSLGDLGPVFAATRRALRPGGWFAFSAEVRDGEGFVLDTTRRYRHALAYLKEEAAAHGLQVAHDQTIVARYEKGRPAQEYLLILRRSNHPVSGSTAG